jgi:hypothetical protein
MDPNEALAQLRIAITALTTDPGDLEAVEQAITAFDALDDWLSDGGYGPAEWS